MQTATPSPVKFIGDLSLADARVLETYARKHPRILEFGVGGSTQIFAQCCPATLVCVETNPGWISVTHRRVQELQEPYTMPSFVGFGAHPTQQSFDLIFVDGIDTLRRQFAIHTWPLLVAGGVMLFHDTRRSQDVANVLAVCAEFHSEVGAVSFNEDESNTSIICKRTPLQYVNWNLVEGKPHWMYGGDHSKGLRDLP